MSGKDGDIEHRRREDKRIRDRSNDPYMMSAKPEGPAVCPECKVVFSQGRWQWSTDVPENANEVLCAACRRIKEKVPAGFLVLEGEFFQQHRKEIMNLMENKVQNQKARHPMKRVMDVEDEDDGSTVISFTDNGLAQEVGSDIESAYEGNLDIKRSDEGVNRVYWAR